MKTCKVCRLVKPRAEFPKSPRMRDGHENKCTACKVDYNRKRIAAMVVVPVDNKICIDCKQLLPAEKFYKSSYYKDGLDCRCCSCGDLKTYSWRDKNSEQYNKSHSAYMATLNPYTKYLSEIKRRYGCTKEMYESMIQKQNNKCAMNDCTYMHNPSVFKGGLCVDHCHTTKKIRGLLCERCNKGLGHFKDSIKVLESAIDYLKKAA